MSTIAFCMMPLAGPMNGALNLASVLRARGHRVVFVGMRDSEEFVAPRGFEFDAIYEQWFPKGYMQRWRAGGSGFWRSFQNQRRIILESRDHFRFLIRGGFAEFELALAKLGADALVLDGSHRPTWALLAHKAGLKCVYLHTTMPPWDDPSRPPCFTALAPGRTTWARWRVRWAWRSFFARRRLIVTTQTVARFGYDWLACTRELARVCGYPVARLNFRSVFSALLELPELILFPKAFDFPGPEVPRRHYVEGEVDHDRQEPEFAWDRIDPRKKLIYCSLGSIHASRAFFQDVLRAFAGRPDWQLVLNLGDRLQAGGFTDVPPDAILVNRAPQLALLKRSAAMITHGGINSIRECVHFRVPMVIFPVTFDQPGAAARAQFHGLGVMQSLKQAQPLVIRGLLEQVLSNPAYPARLAAMAAEFEAVAREQPGIKLIESLASQTLSPAQRG